MNARKRFTHKLNNWLHSLLLLGGMGVLLAVIGHVLAGPQGMLITVGGGVLVAVLGPTVSSTMVLRMYRAVPVGRAQAPGLVDLVAELASRAALPAVPRVYYVPSPVMNAFSVGRRGDAHIAVTDGLLRGLQPRELVGVIAHEVSHVANNDTWLMNVADGVSRIVGFGALVGQVLVLVNLPLVLLGRVSLPWLPLLLLVLAPTLSALLQLALSRTREFDADLDAAELTGDPEGLASALQRLERQQRRWWQRVLVPGRYNEQPSLLRTHPHTEERVARLLSLRQRPERQTPLPSQQSWLHGTGDMPTPHCTPRHRWHGLWY